MKLKGERGMKVSISSWSYRRLFDQRKIDLLSFVDEVKRLGADGLEILPQHVDAKDPGGHLRQVVRKAAAGGLEISAVIAGNDFARAAARERADQVERMKQWIAFTAEAGLTRMNTFTGYHAPGQDFIAEFYRVVDSYREVMPLAEQRGVLLCIENHSTVCADADGLLRLIQAVGSPNLRTNPDPTNFVADFTVRGSRAREAIYTETQKVAPLASNAHLKVADFTDDGEHAYADVKRIIDILRGAGYDQHIVLEVYGPGDDAPEICAKGIALVRKYL
jgi:sugar phosphate isomerase/epimerase